MNTRAILPVKISLTQGDFYTLWAPTWRQGGSEWQAFFGDADDVLAFNSPEALLVYLEDHGSADLSEHPKWEAFQSGGADRVVPTEKNYYDLIGVPAFLAGRPSHENVSAVSRNFQLARSLAEIAGAQDANIFFASHSILGNVHRGHEHYSVDTGLDEWSGVGRTVLANWENVIASLDEAVRVINDDELDSARLKSAAAEIATASSARAEERAKAEKEAEEARNAADPYDSSPWAQAGIDPVKITVQGKGVYTLRTYLGDSPVFLGKFGEIFTFPTAKHMLRWLVDNEDHELARVSTWDDLQTLANAGELEVTVHPDNSYSLNGIAADIEKGVDTVDTQQMSKAYELMADAADWAEDDSLNSYLLANPRMQDYLAYMMGSTEAAGYVPSAPFNDKAEGWRELEELLVKRFSKF